MKYLQTYQLFERRKNIWDLNQNIGLFIYEDSLTIYDIDKQESNDGVLAYAGLSDYDNFYQTSSLAAEKGYGPLIYEIAMMYAYENNKFVMVSRDGDVRSDAFNIWKRFHQDSDKNIIKKSLKINDDNFNLCLFHGDQPEESVDEKEESIRNIIDDFGHSALIDIYAYNSQMKMKPYNRYFMLIDNAKKSNLDPKIISDLGNDFFLYKYNS